jgi:hypothetical protein
MEDVDGGCGKWIPSFKNMNDDDSSGVAFEPGAGGVTLSDMRGRGMPPTRPTGMGAIPIDVATDVGVRWYLFANWGFGCLGDIGLGVDEATEARMDNWFGKLRLGGDIERGIKPAIINDGSTSFGGRIRLAFHGWMCFGIGGGIWMGKLRADVRSGRDPTGGGIFIQGTGNGGTVMYGLICEGGGGGGLGGGPEK